MILRNYLDEMTRRGVAVREHQMKRVGVCSTGHHMRGQCERTLPSDPNHTSFSIYIDICMRAEGTLGCGERSAEQSARKRRRKRMVYYQSRFVFKSLYTLNGGHSF